MRIITLSEREFELMNFILESRIGTYKGKIKNIEMRMETFKDCEELEEEYQQEMDKRDFWKEHFDKEQKLYENINLKSIYQEG